MIAAVLAEAIAKADAELAAAYEEHAPLVRWLVAHALPVPAVLRATVETTLRRRVLANLRAADPSFQVLREQMAEAAMVKADLDTPEIALAASQGLAHLLARVVTPEGQLDPPALDVIARSAEVAARMKSGVDLWFAQNATYQLLAKLPVLRTRAATGDLAAGRVAADLERLARALRLAVAR